MVGRIGKALAFWLLTGIAAVRWATLALAEAAAAPGAETWLFVAVFGLVGLVPVAIIHRLVYGRWFTRADLERLSPIRPAEPAE